MARYAQAVVDQITAAHAIDVQRLLGEATEDHYPARSSTAPAEPANQTDDNGQPIKPPTAVERAALGRRDPAGKQARQILDALRDWHELSVYLWQQLPTWDPNRALALCPRCEMPFERGYTRCQRIFDGVQCGSTGAADHCTNCGDEFEAGQRRSKYGECQPCYRNRLGARKRTQGSQQ